MWEENADHQASSVVNHLLFKSNLIFSFDNVWVSSIAEHFLRVLSYAAPIVTIYYYSIVRRLFCNSFLISLSLLIILCDLPTQTAANAILSIDKCRNSPTTSLCSSCYSALPYSKMMIGSLASAETKAAKYSPRIDQYCSVLRMLVNIVSNASITTFGAA